MPRRSGGAKGPTDRDDRAAALREEYRPRSLPYVCGVGQFIQIIADELSVDGLSVDELIGLLYQDKNYDPSLVRAKHACHAAC